jgi:putative oxidoreductase
MRLVTGGAAAIHGLTALAGSAPPVAVFHLLCAAVGVLLIIGLGTPIVAAIATVGALVHGVANPADAPFFLLLGTLSAAIGLVGPGIWSLDAHLFGWRRVEIPDRPGASMDPRDSSAQARAGKPGA